MSENKATDLSKIQMDDVVNLIKTIIHDKNKQRDIFVELINAWQKDKIDLDNKQLVVEFINSFR